MGHEVQAADHIDGAALAADTVEVLRVAVAAGYAKNHPLMAENLDLNPDTEIAGQ